MEEVRVEPVTGARRALPALGAWGLRPGARTAALLKSAGWWVLSVGIVTGLWELVAALGWINAIILPPPHEFIGEIRNQAQFLMPKVGVERTGANFVALTAIVASLERVLTGLALAFVAAVVTGGLAFYYDVFGKLSLPTITLLAPIAPVAWIPLAIVWLGFGEVSKITLITYACFFSIYVNTHAGVRNVDPLYVKVMKIYGNGTRDILTKVVMYSMLPYVFTGLRYSAAVALILLVAVELVGAQAGLGFYLTQTQAFFLVPEMFATIMVFGLLGFLANLVILYLERRVIKWRQAVGAEF